LSDKEKFIIISHDLALNESLEKSNDITKMLSTDVEFEVSGYKVVVQSVSNYEDDRKLYKCVALKY